MQIKLYARNRGEMTVYTAMDFGSLFLALVVELLLHFYTCFIPSLWHLSDFCLATASPGSSVLRQPEDGHQNGENAFHYKHVGEIWKCIYNYSISIYREILYTIYIHCCVATTWALL